MFGGNSNWRGPIWFPLNYLVVTSLKSYEQFFGDSFTVEYPTGSGQRTLGEVAEDLRTADLDLPARRGRAAALLRRDREVPGDPLAGPVQFNEYFHGDNGAGLGASHQTGWTGLVADLIRRRPRARLPHARGAARDGAPRPEAMTIRLGPQACGTPRRGGGARMARLRRCRRLRDGHGRRAPDPALPRAARRRRPAARRRGCSASSSLEPVLVVGDARFRLATDEWAGGDDRPAWQRAARHRSIWRTACPRWRWQVGDIVLERELALAYGTPGGRRSSTA